MLDERTKAYLELIRQERGYVGRNDGYAGIQEILAKKYPGVKAERTGIFEGYLNSGPIELYHYTVDGQSRYCAELSYQTDVDDYNIETHIFTRQPSRRDVMEIRSTQDVESAFTCRGLRPEFTCWECGCETHWLDTPGTLSEKMSQLKEGYCGC